METKKALAELMKRIPEQENVKKGLDRTQHCKRNFGNDCKGEQAVLDKKVQSIYRKIRALREELEEKERIQHMAQMKKREVEELFKVLDGIKCEMPSIYMKRNKLYLLRYWKAYWMKQNGSMLGVWKEYKINNIIVYKCKIMGKYII